MERAGALLAAGVLGHSFGALANCVLAQLSGQVKADGSLHFATGDGVFLVVVSQSGGLRGDTLEDVVDERVHDAHGLAGDASVGVNLLQDLVDVDGVALLAVLSPFLHARGLGLGGGGGFLLAFGGGNLSRHDDDRSLAWQRNQWIERSECVWKEGVRGFYREVSDQFGEDHLASDQSGCV